jgi:pantetheine-phosphate adenylyltransferase
METLASLPGLRENPGLMRRAIYPGTFDPVTLGHLDVLARAARLFDEVIVAVAEDSSKNATFTTAQRVELLKESTRNEPWASQVKVTSFRGLLVEFARKGKAVAVIRGLRAVSDFEYEFQLALTNRRLHPDLESVFLMPRETLSFISSQLVRELARLGAPLEDFVPPAAVTILRQHYAKK